MYKATAKNNLKTDTKKVHNVKEGWIKAERGGKIHGGGELKSENWVEVEFRCDGEEEFKGGGG